MKPQHYPKFQKKLMSQSQGNLWADGRRDTQTVFYRSLSAKTRGTVVLSSLLSIFSALLEDSLFWSYFPHFRVYAQRLEDSSITLFLAVLSPLLSICSAPSRTLGGFFDYAFFNSTIAASEYLCS